MRIRAPLAVFDEPTSDNLLVRRADLWRQFLLVRQAQERAAIQKFLERVRADRELYGILKYYGGPTEEQVGQVIALLNECGLCPSWAIAVPFVLEMCAHLLSTSGGTDISDNTRALIWRIYRSPGFIDRQQQERFARIFGEVRHPRIRASG